MRRYPDTIETLQTIPGGTHNMYGKPEKGGGYDAAGNPVTDVEGFVKMSDCRLEEKRVEPVNGNDGPAFFFYYVAYVPTDTKNLPKEGDRVRLNGMRGSVVDQLAKVANIAPTYGSTMITLEKSRE